MPPTSNHRKPPPPFLSPPSSSSSEMQRAPSMNSGRDEYGRPIAWGGAARRGAGAIATGGRGSGMDVGETTNLTGLDMDMDLDLVNGDGEGAAGGGVSFEAAVAALRGRGGTSANPTSSSAAGPAAAFVSGSGPVRGVSVDPNYPKPFEFHAAPSYSHVRPLSIPSRFLSESGSGSGSGYPGTPETPPNARTHRYGRPYAQDEDGDGDGDEEDETTVDLGYLPSPVTNGPRRGNSQSRLRRRMTPRSRSPTPQPEDTPTNGKAYTGSGLEGMPLTPLHMKGGLGTPGAGGTSGIGIGASTPTGGGGRMRAGLRSVSAALKEFQSGGSSAGPSPGPGVGGASPAPRRQGFMQYISPSSGNRTRSSTSQQRKQNGHGVLESEDEKGMFTENEDENEEEGAYSYAYAQGQGHANPTPTPPASYSRHMMDEKYDPEVYYERGDGVRGGGGGDVADLDLGRLEYDDPDADADVYPVDEDEKALLHYEDSEGKQHFGPAPMGRVKRRHRAKKKVALTGGNLVLDLAIPTKLESFLPAPTRGEDEMMKTRYTAVTCDPDEYFEQNFTLRQSMNGRETELFVVITMYNEDEVLFLRTLYGVMRNISHLEGRKNSSTWGSGSWQKVVVCIVADGRKNISPLVLDCLASLGVYQEGAMKNSVQDKPVQAHVFEYTTSFALTPDMRFKFPDKGVVPTQIIFCLKEKNARKINSHRWFFNAFAKVLEPKVCILLDVGTRPHVKALYHLWKAFDTNSNVGGACGELATYKGKAWRNLLNPLVAAQDFEYRIANILDKATESVFGYCAVLPGAFSAYRWRALQNNKDGTGPLASYYKGEVLHGKNVDTFTANMYLAEDRILCWEIVAKPGANYVLKYVKAAVAETDCPDTVAEFISQRRRWLNGSFFAAVYALTHSLSIFGTKHSAFRKCLLCIQAIYNFVMLVFSWFSLANFFIFFVLLTSGLEAATFNIPNINVLNSIVQYAYVGCLIACFLFSMGNRPQGSAWKYKTAIVIFAVLTVYMIVCAILCAVKTFQNASSPLYIQMVISVIATYGVYVAASIISLKPMHLVTSFLQYILFQATYINLLNVYAFSNLHDLSWGTKGSDMVSDDLGSVQGQGGIVEVELLAGQKDIDAAYSDALDNLRVRKPVTAPMAKTPAQEEQAQKDYYANFRTNVLLVWVLSNGLLASVILAGGGASSTFDGTSSRTSVYMLIILVFVAGTSLFRFLGACIYLLMTLFGL